MTKEDGDKLVAFVDWLNSDANTQVHRWVDVRCAMRVVNGDLAHLYDDLLAGHKLDIEGTTSLAREVSHYKFVPPKTHTIYGVEIEMFDEKPSIGTIGYAIDFGRRAICGQDPFFYISCHKFVDDGEYKVNETFIKNKNDAGAVADAMTKQLLAGR